MTRPAMTRPRPDSPSTIHPPRPMKPLVLALLVALAAPAAAQSDAAAVVERGRALVTAGYFANSADTLLAARATLGVAAQAADPEVAAWAAYYAALADYRLASVFWGSDPERAVAHAEGGAAALAPVVERAGLPDALRAEAYALHAALLSAQMGIDPARAGRLGPAAQASTRASLRLAPDNPRVLFQSASSLLTTPPEWGGDPAEGARELERAATLFGEPAGPLAPMWGEDEAWAWLGLAHLMAGDAAAARPAIERAEALHPASPFVQYKLKPWLDRVESAP